MKIYIAAREKVKAKALGDYLKREGYEIVSNWVYQARPMSTDTAIKDLEDVKSCDVLIDIAAENLTCAGGKHIETGYALGLGKVVIHQGPIENVFHYHPKVITVDGVMEVISKLKEISGE